MATVSNGPGVDIEANPDEPRVADALQEIRGNTNYFKRLGTYPRRSIDNEEIPPRRGESPSIDESQTEPEPSAPVEVWVPGGPDPGALKSIFSAI